MRWVGKSRAGEKERDAGPEELQTDTRLLMVCTQFQVQRRACVRFYVFRKLSTCFFFVWLIKAFGLSIRLDVCSRESSCLLPFALLVLCAPVVVHSQLSGKALPKQLQPIKQLFPEFILLL